MNNKIDLIISPKRVLKVLVVIVLLLTIASIIGQTYKYTVGHDRYIVDFFDLDKEFNIPNWYASTTLLFCSLLLVFIAFGSRKAKARFFLHWIFLSAIFLIFALDEGLKLHEQSITPVREFFSSIGFASVGFFYYSWVFPAAILVIIFAASYVRFLMNLPSRTRYLFIIAGVLYVGGALLMESMTGLYASYANRENLTYAILTNIEELLEMVGILVFIYALMSYIKSDLPGLRIGIGKS
ncbi:MAG: hypothetical protein H8E19_05750 [Deltaproteobacteria bacterium]|uniref:Uncharacterized protein n=1 Tax=Candidatus Desulfacyla euxinica TaxID=2841693 RepID=A0A8J6MY65_9DELT|nr:hypothetical protein [Candidatus Desulfacyla euxinica]MBL7217582.1 hypothetical protein [Desulfobacteraceae bacterium]